MKMTRATNPVHDGAHCFQLHVELSPSLVNLIGDVAANDLLISFTKEAKPFGVTSENGRHATMTMWGAKSEADIVVAGLEPDRIKLQSAAQKYFNKNATSSNGEQVSVSAGVTYRQADGTQVMINIGVDQPA